MASPFSTWLQRLEFSNEDLRRRGLLTEQIETIGVSPTVVEVSGQRLLQFVSDDWLNLGHDPALHESIKNSLAKEDGQRFGSGTSSILAGTRNELADLENETAAFLSTQSAVVFASSYAACQGTLASITTKDDIVFAPASIRASLLEGVSLSGAKLHLFPSGRWGQLRSLLQAHRPSGLRAFILAESNAFLDGQEPVLQDLTQCSEDHDAILVVDESHALGVYGSRGQGRIHELDLASRIPFQIGSFGKGLGCAGGFVAGPNALICHLRHHVRSLLETTAISLAQIAACRSALSRIQELNVERMKLRSLSSDLRKSLRERGWNVDQSESPIIGIRYRSSKLAGSIAEKLLQKGILVGVIRPPVVPEGESLLRISVNLQHTVHDCQRFVSSLAEVG